MGSLNIRNLISGIGVLVSLCIAVGGPLGYFVIGFEASTAELAIKAELSAGRAARYIFAHDRMWQYQQVHLAEVIEIPANVGSLVRQRIADLRDNEVVQEEVVLPLPVQRVRVPLRIAGETVGWLDAEASLRPLLVRSGYVGVVSSLLGLIAWLGMRLLPLRVLDRTLLRLSMQSDRFQAALDNMTQGLCMFDGNNRLVVYNRRFVAMFGTPEPGAAASELFATKSPREQDLDVMFALPDAMDHGPDGGVHELADGRVIQVSRQAVAKEGLVATYEDVTERRRSQEQLSHMARYDALTGLPNRVLFREHLERVLPRIRRGDAIAVLCLDLDRFKAVNDTLGHPAGDELLRQVARRLREVTRETDLVARLGGDEFAIVQVGAVQPLAVATLADRLVQVLGTEFEIKGQQVTIGTSIGVVQADDESCNCDELLRSADIAMYLAKAAGRGTWCFFEPEMDVEIQQRRQLEADLRRALAEEQFEVYYQPLIEAKTQTLSGFEALIRWHHPERGLVSPAEFIQLSEETGLIRPLGAWVLMNACAAAAQWPEHLKIAVNLSPVQFVNGNLIRDVEQALATSGLAAGRLELEVTESVLLEDNIATLNILQRLQAMGARVAMDDFGTGYSSLSYLRRFPFDKIKIDQSFVRNLARGNGSVAIIRAVVGLGRALGMEVLAEGVETDEQLSILREEGCNELQGFLFSKPCSLPNVAGIIDRHLGKRSDWGSARMGLDSALSQPAG
jgi:diguanylate cyclase (GGDEF)-like protein